MDEMPVESRQKPPARQKVHRLGMVLFVAYVAMYVGFMGLVLAWPEALSWRRRRRRRAAQCADSRRASR